MLPRWPWIITHISFLFHWVGKEKDSQSNHAWRSEVVYSWKLGILLQKHHISTQDSFKSCLIKLAIIIDITYWNDMVPNQMPAT